jgi:hypothetical protein
MTGISRVKMLLWRHKGKRQDITKLEIYQMIFTGMTPEKCKLGTWT